MRNMIKILAIALLGLSAASVDAWGLPDKVMRRECSKKVVDGVNGMHPYAPYFPGTWPMSKPKTVKKMGKRAFVIGKKLKFTLPNTFEIPQGWLDETEEGVKTTKIRPEIQLGFAALCKWVPAFLIVRYAFKRITKKEKQHHRHHDDD